MVTTVLNCDSGICTFMIAETVDVVVANALIKLVYILRVIEPLLQPLYVTSDNGICIDCAVVSSNAVWLLPRSSVLSIRWRLIELETVKIVTE
jgi:hypothetical protein